MTMRQDASTGQMIDDGTQTPEEPQDSKKPTMDVKIYAPFRMYFEGKAYSLSGLNESGPFDILPHHHNFICLLMPCDLVVRAPFGNKVIRISRAFMHVKAEKIVVFVDV
jgi:F0F1-type ATP synthase epsilon subunit